MASSAYPSRSRVPFSLKVPRPRPSVRLRWRRTSSSVHPVVLYSTERQSFWNRGYPFLPRFFSTTVLVEARDGGTRALRRRLPRHGVQLAHEGVLARQDRTVLLFRL